MFDARLRRLIDPPLNAAGRRLARRGISANLVSSAGFVLGLAAAVAVALGHPLIGLGLLLANRLADGLDGAVARASGITDLGGFLDIVFDFLIYGALPLAFVLSDPAANALPGAVLLASFYASGSAFLAFAVVADRRGLRSDAQGIKSLYYLSGLAEGGETIAVLAAMCLWPQHFAAFAYGYAAICWLSAALRIVNALWLLKH